MKHVSPSDGEGSDGEGSDGEGSDGEGPRVIKLLQRVQDTGAFLRMAAIELRRIAEQSPDIGVELRTVAQKLDWEADDLARGGTE